MERKLNRCVIFRLLNNRKITLSLTQQQNNEVNMQLLGNAGCHIHNFSNCILQQRLPEGQPSF